jgi:hypothetical protein
MSSSNTSLYIHKNPLNIANTTVGSALGLAALTVEGGISTRNNMHVGGYTSLYGITSGYTQIKASVIAGNNTITLPSNNPTSQNQFLISDISGNLSYSAGNATDFTFSGTQNVVAPSTITNFNYTSGNFEVNVSVNIVADTNLSQIYKLTGLLSAGASGWNLTAIAISGDNTGVQFYINGTGQIQYTSPSYTGFISLNFIWTNYSPSSTIVNVNTGTTTTKTLSITQGALLNVNGSTVTDSGTGPSGTLAEFSGTYIAAPTLSALNAGVTTSTANTIYIEGSPNTGANETITTKYALNVNSGNTRLGGNAIITGSLSKGSGTFDIPHPIKKDKRLVHSFIEGPRCDNIYRGSVILQNGKSIVNLDTDCVNTPECAMSDGTFESLNSNPVYYLQNDSSFDRIRGKIIGNLLNIFCENITSNDTVHWMVIAERHDQFIKDWKMTTSDGKLITEYDC